MSRDQTGQCYFGKTNESSLWAAPAQEWMQSQSCLYPGFTVFFLFSSGRLVLSGNCRSDVSSGDFGTTVVVRPSDTRVQFKGEGAIRGLVVGFENSLLQQILEPFRPGLRKGLVDLLFSGSGGTVEFPFNAVIRERLIPSFSAPQVTGPARSLWYESQIKELISLTCFSPSEEEGEFFCSRQKRLSKERIDRAKSWLALHYEETFDLQRLSKDIGVSPCYLSRTFSAEEGITISQYIRRLRVEKAAELLLSGGFTVSEAAIEVGYQSLSHFSKAFLQVKGCLPSKYDAA